MAAKVYIVLPIVCVFSHVHCAVENTSKLSVGHCIV